MKTSIAPPPPAPAAVDPGQSSLAYINAMADPALQQRLYDSEAAFRPQYNQLNLADMQQYMQGSDGQIGALDLFGQASQRSGEFQAAANTQQRLADIQDVEAFGGRASEAFRNANPGLMAAFQRAEGLQDSSGLYNGLESAINSGKTFADIERGSLGQSLYDRAQGPEMGAVGSSLQARAAELAQSKGQLTPDELRTMQQGIRENYGQMGRGMSSGAVSAEALGRLANERGRMMEDLSMASGLNQAGLAEVGQNRAFSQSVYGQDLGRQDNNRQFGFGQQQQGIANQGLLAQLRASQLGQDRGYAMQLAQGQAAMASDPFQAILGRQSGALQYGQGQQGFAGQLTSSMQGPQLFDPNAGINLALQNNANTAGYNSNIYGANAALAGAKAGANASILGSAIQAGGMMAAFCWVAREVYGEQNPRWMLFRHWLFNFSPNFFFNAYAKYGERFAAFIKDKPMVKGFIRRWMDKKINTLKFL